MDVSIQKALNDKLYDKRRNGALELEKLVRDTVLAGNHDRVYKIVEQLCHDYAYAVHQPYARNGGLIGLAAASIALGPEVAPYLEQVVPPVLACFNDQDARVRYYACESMYNIAKTCKGEILPYFNEVFDAMAKLAADHEVSVKNGADLLDRLIKDIVSESAATYVSVVHPPERPIEERQQLESQAAFPTAFSLKRFIPLLQERVSVVNPYTRTFLVSWILILDAIPDLELVSYLPSFLGGLFRFLNDASTEVVTSTQELLERFLSEIKQVARVKRMIADNRQLSQHVSRDRSRPQSPDSTDNKNDYDNPQSPVGERPQISGDEPKDDAEQDSDSEQAGSRLLSEPEEDFVPGQDVFVDHPKILQVVIPFLHDPSEHVQVTALRWIDGFFEISPDDLMPHAPELLNQVLPALSSNSTQVRKAATRVNGALVSYIEDKTDEEELEKFVEPKPLPAPTSEPKDQHKRAGSDIGPIDRSLATDGAATAPNSKQPSRHPSPPPLVHGEKPSQPEVSLDYEAAVNALTQQFLNNNEATRAASLSWLIMLQKKAPRKVLAAHDTTFPALLKTLADTSDTVVTRDLQLLCQISKYSDDSYFSFFMINLLQLFAGDRRLLETRGNLIIRQLCLNLNSERIYRTMAGCLEKNEDAEFVSTMVQNLNNNLITAPELIDLRKKLRYTWDSRDGQTLFVTLFKAWCHNAVATMSICLLAQAYDYAYQLLQIFADIEITVTMLIQIDKLVQFLESPVFTFLRLQLLEPDRYPHLYKTLYGLLMLLPQSAAFAALKNRLNTVSAIGYLHVPQTPQYRSSVSGPANSNTPATTPVSSTFERGAVRLKTKDEGPVRWADLLDRFKQVQERGRRLGRAGQFNEDEQPSYLAAQGTGSSNLHGVTEHRRLMGPTSVDHLQRSKTSPAVGPDAARAAAGAPGLRSASPTTTPKEEKERKSRFSTSRLSRLTGGSKAGKK